MKQAPPSNQIEKTVIQGDRSVKKGVFWILTPFFLLLILVLVQVVFRFLTRNGNAEENQFMITILNIFSYMLGLGALILFPVGILMGIQNFKK